VLSRRAFLKLIGTAGVAGLGFSSYALAEPQFRLGVTRYRLTPPGWSGAAETMRIVAIADIHACDPWMPPARIEAIVSLANRIEPDLIVLLGDYVSAMPESLATSVPPEQWARLLAGLRAPLGVHAVLGNHDWRSGVDRVRGAFAENSIPVMENEAVLLEPQGAPAFWLAGLGDQFAHRSGLRRFHGVDDLPGTLAHIPEDGRPIILLAHEPDIFPQVPERVGLTLCGHTHGGQVALPLLGRPVVPSAYGQRYAYGRIVETGRNLIVSGGLGCSGLPIRFGVPPEVVVVDIGGEAEADA